MENQNSAKLRLVQITDVYTLHNFPRLKTLLDQYKAEELTLGKTYSVLTGDFLAPYLLSSFDKGVGIIKMLNMTPIDYLTWGNHEADLCHFDVMRREKEYRGIWINSNMKSHESFKNSTCQYDSAIINVVSPDGSNKRTLGMCAVLSNTAGLYKPGAFGGATIEDPWECLKEYNNKLNNQGCDMVLPLCHLYEHQDEKTCTEFDFPVILGGHDHHSVDREINGTRLLKPGMDANKAIVLDLEWPSAKHDRIPIINVQLVDLTEYPADVELSKEVEKAYSILDPLYKTDLAFIPEKYYPISSSGARQKRVTMATYLCTQIKLALNLDTECSTNNCDCVLIKGGNIRGGRDYDDSNLTLESLKSELKEEQTVNIFLIPGHALEASLRESWEQPNAGWFQYDDGVEVDSDGCVISVGNFPLDRDRLYRVGSFLDFNANYGSSSIHQYFEENPEGLPDPDAGMGCHVLLLELFSQNIWKRIWTLLDADGDGTITKEELRAIDKNEDGIICKDDIRHAIEKVLGMSTHEHEHILIDYVMSIGGDTNNDGQITLDELNKAL
jgi:2',3'-cyclic-nucleotide 2'-phosphodiesterase (5'-nucleotidase family)